jgi:UDP-GlcNAc:undecaprenyl-phosphate/decaprenyl-phosphate GlcNAc-1-phosphate transferase
MREYVLTLLAAAAVTYLLTPLVRRFAIAAGALHAARDRDVHVAPTPLLGGFAMYAGLAVGLLVASRLPQLNSAFQDTNMAKGLLLAGGLIVVMGFVDDRWGMGALSKLAGQVAAGVILVWSGAVVTWLPYPNGGILSLSSDEGTVATILVVVVTINAVNFIDGLDGLAAGVVGIGAAAFFIYYYTLTHRLNLTDQTGPALASAVLAGMCLGFLPHNFNPARIFMGDTGSMLIGLLLAYAPLSNLASTDPTTLTRYSAGGGTVNRFGTILPLLLPAAIMLIPYVDLLLAVIRRTRAGRSVFAPDRKHLHHRLLDIGHSHRRSVLLLYLWAALFAGSVTGLSIVRTPLSVLAAVTAGGMLALLLVSMPRLRWWARPRPLDAAPAAVSAANAASDTVPAGGVPAAAAAVAAPATAAPRAAAAPPAVTAATVPDPPYPDAAYPESPYPQAPYPGTRSWESPYAGPRNGHAVHAGDGHAASPDSAPPPAPPAWQVSRPPR